MSEDVVKIEVNGELLEARKGAMIIEVTDALNIKIPRFCYHQKLSIAANCRMCLVEVEIGGRPAPKPLPACATPIADGMKVWTASEKAIEAQQGTMEFLLINHPLDCPICDQGGECELQDVSMGYGAGISRFAERKRAVKDKDIGPLVETEMTRCIHCTRCVRFGTEIAGLRELGTTGRGEHMEIGTYVEKSMASELSGNVIDLCPVGALTSKPARHSGRSWEYVQHAGVAAHDSAGSNTYIHTIRGQVMRVVPRDNDAVNESWLSDRDRFSYEALYSPERITTPWYKNGASDWSGALAATRDGINAVIEQHGCDAVGVLISPTATVEEMYLAQKLARGLGIKNIDHRLRQADFSDQEQDPLFPWLGHSLEELENIDAALIIGSNVRMDQPLIGHRIRKAALNGGRISFVNPRDFDFRFPVAQSITTAPVTMLDSLLAIASTIARLKKVDLPEGWRVLAADTEQQAIAEQIINAERATVLLGTIALAHPQFAQLRAVAAFISQHTDAALGYLPEANNSAGAALTGALPHRGVGGGAVEQAGLDVRAMFESPRKAYILIGFEPEYDCWDGVTALSAIQQADFVIAMSAYINDTIKNYADVVLPIALFAETSGTYVNAEGRWQSFQGSCQPLQEVRPAWKILRVLGNMFALAGFDYLDSQQVLAEVEKACGDKKPDNTLAFEAVALGNLDEPSPDESLYRVGEIPIYASDAVVRRAPALQQTVLAETAQIRISAATAKKLGLHNVAKASVKQSNGSVVLPLTLDDSIAADCVYIAGGLAGSKTLGPLIGPVEVSSA